MKKVKIAMISKWFVHVERFTKLLKEYEESEIVAVWDYDVKRGKEFAEEIGCPFVEDYEELLKNPEIDGFVIMAPVTMHEELIIKAVKQENISLRRNHYRCPEKVLIGFDRQ